MIAVAEPQERCGGCAVGHALLPLVAFHDFSAIEYQGLRARRRRKEAKVINPAANNPKLFGSGIGTDPNTRLFSS